MDIELREILDKVYANKMKPDEAQWKICVLFNNIKLNNMEQQQLTQVIQELLFDCKVLGIDVFFVSGPPGIVAEDFSKVAISIDDNSDDEIYSILYNTIVQNLNWERELYKKKPGLKYKEYWDNINPVEVEANWDLKVKDVKNKYLKSEI